MPTKWLTVTEASDYLKIGRSTLYKMISNGKLPAHRVGREWRFDAQELDEYLKAGKLSLPNTK